MSKPTAADALYHFLASYGHVVTNALANQERHMRDAAADAARTAKTVAATPEPPRDGFMSIAPTPAGWAQMSERFGQSADSAAAALAAFGELQDASDEEAGR